MDTGIQMKISVIKTSQLYFIFSFVILIAAGTLLLILPCSFAGTGKITAVDAAFTATSAVCVTGLLTVPMHHFSWIGQAVILGLIQLGGLGIMTLTTGVLLSLGHNLSYSSTLLLANMSDHFSQKGTESLNRMVLRYMLLAEGIGFLVLFPLFLLEKDVSWYQALWFALFHAVSGFCNAGISLLPGGMAGIPAGIKLVVAVLFICGGLGIYVVYDIRLARRNQTRLHSQTKLILAWTTGLLISGTLLLWFLQHGSRPISWVDAFFQSAACRTAGFNSINIDTLSAGSMAVIVILMLIGAAPGSTGGGMKVTTFALVAAGLFSSFKGSAHVILYKRIVPPENVLKAFVIMIMYILLTGFGAIVLWSLTECTMDWALFETASALATVGLERMNPNAISAGGKVFLISFMFLGRVGIFTFFLFLLGRERRSRLQYPEERMIVS